MRHRRPHDGVTWFLLPIQVVLVGGRWHQSLFRLLSFVLLTKLEQMFEQ